MATSLTISKQVYLPNLNAGLTYPLDTYAAFGYTVTSVEQIQTSSGTVTAAVQINGTNITGLSGISVSSTPQNVSATGANTVATGDALTLVFSSNSSAQDIQFTLVATRTAVSSVSNSDSSVTVSPTAGDVVVSLPASGVTAGSYTNTNISVNSAGIVTAASNGSSGGGGVITWQSVQTSNFNATAGSGYPVNTTSAAITATLPASPSSGNIIGFIDYAGTAGTNNITIAGNGNKIQGNTGSVTINTTRAAILLVYIDATQGWIPYSGFAQSSISQSYTVSYLVVAGGGGGGSNGSATTSGAGGTGGGGAGGSSAAGTAGTANTGGGGGGGGFTSANGGAGGSGVVILSVPTTSYSGTTTGSPTVTTSGSNTIMKFTASGSYTA